MLSAQQAREVRIRAARESSACMAGYVLRDNKKGIPISLTSFQKHWHNLCNIKDRLILWSAVGCGKSENISIARVLWEIGRNPNIRIAIISATGSGSRRLMTSIAKYIELSDEYHDVFPDIRPGSTWNSDQLTVERQSYSKDPTVQAFGVHHGSVLGARIDLFILDDILCEENTWSPYMRIRTWDWIQSTVVGRLDADSRIIAIGNVWTKDDSLHMFAAMGWHSERFSLINDDGSALWPEKFPLDVLEKIKARDLIPAEFARQFLCIPRSNGDSICKEEWIKRAIDRGDQRMLAEYFQYLPTGYKTYTGVDLAVQRGDGHDWTVLLTIAIWPDGSREIVALERGKWRGPDIVNRIKDAHERFHSICIVENNAAQDFICQFVSSSSAVPVIPFCTGAQKANPEFGVESLFAEMANSKWIFPSSNGRVLSSLEPLVKELSEYSGAKHTGDTVMAMWFAREGARLGAIPDPTRKWSSFDPTRHL
jgi:hypothetical protein